MYNNFTHVKQEEISEIIKKMLAFIIIELIFIILLIYFHIQV